MEGNFTEEVSEALNTESVERLVRLLPFGSVRCIPCGGKVTYTWLQAYYMTIRKVRATPRVYLDIYVCREVGGENYHLTDIDKRLHTKNFWIRREIAEKKRDLDQFWQNIRIQGSHGNRDDKAASRAKNLVVVDGRSTVPYSKDLRLRIIKALVFPLSGLRKPKAKLLRRKYKPQRRYAPSYVARGDVPRGEPMTKMLSWANADKFHVDSEHPGCRPRGDGAEFRRRNRAREAVAVRKIVDQEMKGIECRKWNTHLPPW